MVDELCSGSVVALEVRLKPQAPDHDDAPNVVDAFRVEAGPWDVKMGKSSPRAGASFFLQGF